MFKFINNKLSSATPITLCAFLILILTPLVMPLKIIYICLAFQLPEFENRSNMLMLNFGMIFHI